MQQEKNQYQEFPQVKVKLSKSGELNFEGELNSESQKLLEQCLQQAEYYRQKSSDSEAKSLNLKTQVDSIVVVFIACLLSLLSFSSYIVVSQVTNWFREVTTDVQR
jgi:cytochrome c-type biogenesis protein CcmH/NrfG